MQQNASRVYLFLRAIFALSGSIMFTTDTLYYVSMLGLNPLQLVLAGTFCELAVVLSEVPTGVVADSFSRRTSTVIGTGITAAAFRLEGSVPWLGGLLPFFVGVVLAEVIRGIGLTFISGADKAWVTKEGGGTGTVQRLDILVWNMGKRPA
ncbi:MAG: hypothetical protein AB1331_04415 [Bacillota bacterium]